MDGQTNIPREIDAARKSFETFQCKTPDEQQILLEKEPHNRLYVLTIKSGAKNALSGKMISQLSERLSQLHEWLRADSDEDEPAYGLLVRGHGGTFCSGMDLVSARESANRECGLKLAEVMQYNMMLIQQLPIVSVAYIDGYALGGGAELALGTDLRLMSNPAQIGFVHMKVGVCCGWGGGSRLVELVGRARAIELLASGRLVGASDALDFGLADGIANDMLQVLRFMKAHTIGARGPIRAMKSMVNSARKLPLNEALRMEARLFATTWGQPAHMRALGANVKHSTHHGGSETKVNE